MTDNDINDVTEHGDEETPTTDAPDTSAEEPEATEAAVATETAAPEAEAEGEGKEKEFEFVEPPTFDLDYKGDCAYEVKVVVPVANEHKLSDDKLDELRHEAEVPGFRRGKAPKKLIERKFGKYLKGEVEQELVNAAFQRLMKEKSLTPIKPPELDDPKAITDRKEDEPLAFTLKFEVRPRVELGKYRGIEVERPVFKVEVKDVDEAIDNVRSRYAVYETLDEGEAAEGDQVIINFNGTIAGEAFPGGSAQNYPYILGTKRFFPEFEDALKGAKAGEQVACQVTFPDTYSSEHLRGKTADFEIQINEIKRRNTPELTDDFAKQAGYESLEDMRVQLEERLRANYSSESNMIAEENALKQIIESSSFEIPKSMIASLAHDHFEERMKELRAKHTHVSESEEMEPSIRAEAEQTAISSIKNWITLQEIAEAEGIEVTDEDFEKEAAALSVRTGSSTEAVARYLGEEERRNTYAMRFLRAKTLAAVISHAALVDKEFSPEEFMQEVEKNKEAGEAE